MAYRDSVASVFGSTTTLNATMPTAVTGDRVIAWVHVDLNGPTITPPSGWTQIGTVATPVFGAPFRAYNLTGGYSGSAPSTTWTLNDPPFAGSVIVIASFSGRESTGQTFVAASSGGGGTTSFSASATGGTAVAGDDIAALILCESVSDVATWSFASWTASYTEREDQAIDWAAMGLATRDNVSAGATGNISATISNGTGQSGAWAAIIVALPAGEEEPEPSAIEADLSTTATVSAALSGRTTLAATPSTTASVTGALGHTLDAAASTTASVAGTLVGNTSLEGDGSTSASLSGALAGRTALESELDTSATVEGELEATGGLEATLDTTASISGTFDAPDNLAADLDTTASLSAPIGAIVNISASLSTTAGLTLNNGNDDDYYPSPDVDEAVKSPFPPNYIPDPDEPEYVNDPPDGR